MRPRRTDASTAQEGTVDRTAGADDASGDNADGGNQIPAPFDYLAPTTVEEALAALAEHGDEAKILAGGQSLLPGPADAAQRTRVRHRPRPDRLAARGPDDGDAIVIGAMTPHSVVGSDPLVAEHAALVSKAVEHLADAQIRHRGTRGALAARRPGGRPRR